LAAAAECPCPDPHPRLMLARVVWWDLGGTDRTIAELRAYLCSESVPAFSMVPGLRLKLWVADENANRRGQSICGNRPWQRNSRCRAARAH
jgi:hypothetical protein